MFCLFLVAFGIIGFSLAFVIFFNALHLTPVDSLPAGLEVQGVLRDISVQLGLGIFLIDTTLFCAPNFFNAIFL
jgi:hypothetical protein